VAKRDNQPAASYSIALEINRGLLTLDERVAQKVILAIFATTIKEVKDDPA
jgi:hypothetical protein